MASFALNNILCFIVVFCFINHNVEAREGKVFFSKFTHLDRSNNKNVVLPLAPAQAPSLALDQTSGRLGDGPFGPGSGMVPQTKESWPVPSITTDAEFEKLMASFEEEKNNGLPEEFEEEESKNSEDLSEQKDKYYNNNNGYTNNNYNDDKRGYSNEEERQGMSDTRFMENGKYFYGTRGRSFENGPNRGYGTRGRSFKNGPSRGYESSRGNEHPNEFETMEEYYKSLEDNSREEYQP